MPVVLRPLAIAILLSSIGASIAAAPRASAGGVLWCRADPVIIVAGRIIEFHLAIPLDALAHVTGPTRYVITVPAGVRRAVVLNDAGFNLHGSQIRFVDGARTRGDPLKIAIVASVRTDAGQRDAFPMELVVVPADLSATSALGTTERTVLKFSLPRQ